MVHWMEQHLVPSYNITQQNVQVLQMLFLEEVGFVSHFKEVEMKITR